MFSFSKWNISTKNQKRPGANPKTNMKFLQHFQVIYEEISGDLIQRVEEIQEVFEMCKIADGYYQDNFDKEVGNNRQNLRNDLRIDIKNLQNAGDLQIITDRDETTDRTEFQEEKNKMNMTGDSIVDVIVSSYRQP